MVVPYWKLTFVGLAPADTRPLKCALVLPTDSEAVESIRGRAGVLKTTSSPFVVPLKFAATNQFGTTYGPDQTFTTVAEPPGQKPSAECDELSRKAKKKEDKAKSKRSKAAKASGKKAKALRREAKSLSKQATKLNQEANACRSTSGGSGK